MKRSVGALGLLGLVCAVSLPAASAAVLYQDDFSTDKLLKSKDTFVQGFGNAIRGDATILPFYVVDGKLTSTSPDAAGGSSDGTGANNDLTALDPLPVDFVLLTGDPKWADVAVQINMRSDGQNTGHFSLILRAAPKTKPADPDTRYEFAYSTANSAEGAGNATKECITPQMDASGIEPPDDVPNLRILKVVGGKYKLLAETDFDRSKIYIPEVNAAGPENEGGAIFRFVAKGNVLQVWIAIPGKAAQKYLEVTDDELKSGLVGLTHAEYNPSFDDLLVEDAP
jgi:hypothetical protein